MNIKKLFLICSLGMIGIGASAAVYSGSCGNDLIWTLNTSTNKLSITGTGEMTNYNSASATPWYTYKTYVKEVFIGDEVTKIGNYAFSGCSSMSSVSISTSVLELGDYVFSDCTSLKGIAIPDNVSVWGRNVFSGCTSLEDVELPKNLKELAWNTFNGCTSLKSIETPISITSIGSGAFSGCTALASIYVPQNVSFISESAFSNCTNLKKVTIDSQLFFSNTQWKSYESTMGKIFGEQVTNYIIGDNVQEISRYSFYECKLSEIHIGNGVKKIGYYAFYQCAELNSVTFGDNPSLKNIGSEFSYCSKLSSIVIPNSVQSIDEHAFDNCSGLTEVIIPNSVNSIGNSAFQNCKSLKTITIPESVTVLGNWVFDSCTSLETINLPSKIKSIGWRPFYETAWRNNHENGALYIGTYLLDWKYGSSWNPQRPSGDLEIQEGTTVIAGSIFYEAEYITSIKIPSSVITIGELCFQGCSSLNKVYIEDLEKWCNISFVAADANPLFSAKHLYLNGEEITSLEIPSSITEIKDFAFFNCEGLTSVNVHDNVNLIGKDAFYGCINIKSPIYNSSTFFYLPPELNYSYYNIPNGIKNIAISAFKNCTKLSGVFLPNVEVIGEDAFSGCSSLQSFSASENLVSLGKNAFRGCTALKKVDANNLESWCRIQFADINSNPLSLAHHLWIGGTETTSLVIPNTVQEIKDYAFVGATGITSVVIPLPITSIGSYAFDGCSNLKTIEFPVSLNSILDYSFRDCTSLRTINVEWEKPIDVNANVFDGVAVENVSLLVPSTWIDTYKGANVWSGFKVSGAAYNFYAIDEEDNVFKILLRSYGTNNSIALADGAYKTLSVLNNIYNLKEITYTRTYNNTNWQSLYVPFEITITDDLLDDFEFAYINGAKLYDYDDNGTPDDAKIEVFKMKSGTLLANMPYLIRAKATGTKTITVNDATLYATAENSIDCSTTALKFTFTGGYSTLGYNDIGGCYLLGGGTWNPVKEGGTMKPMRFYLKIESRDFKPFKAPVIRMTVFGEDGKVTEVQSPLLQEEQEEAPVFDLQGRRVEHPENGIYIINGKKVLVK